MFFETVLLASWLVQNPQIFSCVTFFAGFKVSFPVFLIAQHGILSSGPKAYASGTAEMP
jgi:hypothetical protein